MTFTKLAPHLYLGDIVDAHRLLQGYSFEQMCAVGSPIVVDARPIVIFGSYDGEDRLMMGSIERMVENAVDYIHQGRDVYVHCYAGMERSPFIASLILWKSGVFATLHDAYNYVKINHTQTIQYPLWEKQYMEAHQG